MTALPRRRVLVLANKAWGVAPGQRFRFEQWAPHLQREHGIDLDLLPFESATLSALLYQPGHVPRKAMLVISDFVRRLAAVLRAREYDAVLVFREASLIGPAVIERLLRWTGKPFIFDFDDSIWSAGQEANNGLFSRLHFFGKTDTLCRLAAACTPGNAFLADYAKQRNPRSFVVPTSIELANYPMLPEVDAADPFTVVWTGSTSTLVHFEHARIALEQLAAQRPLRVKVICNKPPDRPISGAETIFVPWSEESEAREIAASHAGIMPLPDNEVTRGKCGLKALQCMAVGRPVVISPVGVNREIIRHGENGFLAETDADFVDALEQLAASPDLRRRIGAAGRQTVAERYSATVVAGRFAEVVRSVTDGRPQPALMPTATQ